jgi:hypothetical protein
VLFLLAFLFCLDTPPVQDPVVDKADSTNHPVVNDEKHEGVTDLDFYRNQAYDKD